MKKEAYLHWHKIFAQFCRSFQSEQEETSAMRRTSDNQEQSMYQLYSSSQIRSKFAPVAFVETPSPQNFNTLSQVKHQLPTIVFLKSSSQKYIVMGLTYKRKERRKRTKLAEIFFFVEKHIDCSKNVNQLIIRVALLH